MGNKMHKPIPDDVLIHAINLTMENFMVNGAKRYTVDKWGEAEKAHCRSLCGQEYRFIETDWIGDRAITLRKAGRLNAVNERMKRKKLKPPSGWYAEYLSDYHWQSFRNIVLAFWGYRCCLCNDNSSKLDVHHNNYDRIGRETITDCIAVCRTCHVAIHRKLKEQPMNDTRA